jgi:SAM-dependent methyltransferase
VPANQISDLYRERRFTNGYLGLEQLGVEYFSQTQEDSSRNIECTLRCIGRMIDLDDGLKTVCEIGCGPKPITLRWLKERGFTTVGIEPIAAYVKTGCEMLGDPKGVLRGRAEQIPLPDESQRVVLLESVLEHVDSPRQAIGESYRVLTPGGVLFIYTTNRHRVSLTGKNGEFRMPFYNFFPDIVKESYVFDHLHYNPSLANYSPLPAVHWFCFSDLCKLGRDAGFARFYSPLDLSEANDSFVAGGIRRVIFKFVRRSPLLRSLALLQFGNAIFMWKPNKVDN